MAPDNDDFPQDRRVLFNTYIYDHFIQNNLYECAVTLLKSGEQVYVLKGPADLERQRAFRRLPYGLCWPKLPAATSETSLYEWFCLFWEISQAQAQAQVQGNLPIRRQGQEQDQTPAQQQAQPKGQKEEQHSRDDANQDIQSPTDNVAESHDAVLDNEAIREAERQANAALMMPPPPPPAHAKSAVIRKAAQAARSRVVSYPFNPFDTELTDQENLQSFQTKLMILEERNKRRIFLAGRPSNPPPNDDDDDPVRSYLEMNPAALNIVALEPDRRPFKNICPHPDIARNPGAPSMTTDDNNKNDNNKNENNKNENNKNENNKKNDDKKKNNNGNNKNNLAVQSPPLPVQASQAPMTTSAVRQPSKLREAANSPESIFGRQQQQQQQQETSSGHCLGATGSPPHPLMSNNTLDIDGDIDFEFFIRHSMDDFAFGMGTGPFGSDVPK